MQSTGWITSFDIKVKTRQSVEPIKPACQWFYWTLLQLWLWNDASGCSLRSLMTDAFHINVVYLARGLFLFEIFLANKSLWAELFTPVGHVLSYACIVWWQKLLSARDDHQGKVTTLSSASPHLMITGAFSNQTKDNQFMTEPSLSRQDCLNLNDSAGLQN